MAMTLCEIFAAMGDEWNVPNYQHHAAKRGYKLRVHPDGFVERTLHNDIEGYDEPTSGPRAAIRKREFVEPNPPRAYDKAAGDNLRRLANQRLRVAQSLKRIGGIAETVHVR